MNKLFNIAGPCNSTDHYMIPLLERNTEIMSLINNKQYFVLHAARQTGKTTVLHELVNDINHKGNYYALYVSLESAQYFTDPEKGIPAIISKIYFQLQNSYLPDNIKNYRLEDNVELNVIVYSLLSKICRLMSKPIVVFFDEADCLSEGTLITFLRQLRDGYVNRSQIPFLHSVALVGMRNIRDYKARILEGRETLGSASPFNIITKALTLQYFSRQDIQNLYHQHTELTGQQFTSEAIDKAFYYTCGQPWLVNALARECFTEILREDTSITITEELIEQAAQNIMLRRDTHLDSLLERLKEQRVKEVIEPLILGKVQDFNILADNVAYCIDLGIIKINDGTLIPANPIYAEVIIRNLSYDSQFKMIQAVENKWITEDGKVDMTGLLKGFQEFWRENSTSWVERYQYKEAAPHLILQAFLQRLVNGGGKIYREFATGRKRMDLCLDLGGKKYPIELKLHYGKKTLPDGQKQLAEYMDTTDTSEGWLVIFDRRKYKSWKEKIYWRAHNINNKKIHVVGC